MNNVVLIGRLTKDPEVRFTESGMAIANFTLAVNRMAKDEADFIRIVAFNKTAELAERFLNKGKQVAIQGRIQTGSYKNKEGQTVFTTDIIADRIEFIGNKEKEADTNFPDFSEIDGQIPF